MDYNNIMEKMEKTINVFGENLSEIRAGRARTRATAATRAI